VLACPSVVASFVVEIRFVEGVAQSLIVLVVRTLDIPFVVAEDWFVGVGSLSFGVVNLFVAVESHWVVVEIGVAVGTEMGLVQSLQGRFDESL
jgi:hypothetical protein